MIKCRDMMNLECDGTEWCYGMKAISELNLQEVHCTNTNGKEAAKYRLCKNIFKQREEKTIKEQAKIVILSFPAYCRYKSLVKKLSNGLVLSKMAIIAFGGVIRSNDCTWISFSRSSFHYPELDKFDFFSDNKGKPCRSAGHLAIICLYSNIKSQLKSGGRTYSGHLPKKMRVKAPRPPAAEADAFYTPFCTVSATFHTGIIDSIAM